MVAGMCSCLTHTSGSEVHRAFNPADPILQGAAFYRVFCAFLHSAMTHEVICKTLCHSVVLECTQCLHCDA